MSVSVKILILSAFSYFFGSIPFGLIVSKKVRGIDVRKFGSGNIGATNVVRVVGFKWGVFVFFLDFLKGFLPVFLVFAILEKNHELVYLGSISAALLAIAGHNWPVFLKFRGGKGVSTSIGCIVALSLFLVFLRIPVMLSLLAWLALYFLTRLVGLASLSAGLSFFISCLSVKETPLEFRFLSFVIALFITVRHRQNIKDIIQIYKSKRR
ncbi:MAG: glycerol-3-phosphate 1-O-acyltransferase PlsY [Candidatus Omnitrophica bacterium]|nr:glycerol-3-phosphate 1-O-acyltransferase PlsY [Candidatus Omnitrophota bacterium]